MYIEVALRDLPSFPNRMESIGIYCEKKKNVCVNKGMHEKKQEHSTACLCVSMRIMPVGVHVDVREYADIEKRYPKPPSGAAAVRS